MKVLVTGHRGFIGEAVFKALEEAGHDVLGYDRKDGQRLLDVPLLRWAMRGREAVVHLAGIPWPDPKADWEMFWAWNCRGSEAVAAAAEQAGVRRLIYTSSTAYYGAEDGMMPVWEVDVAPAGEGARNAVQVWNPETMPGMGRAERARVFYAVSKVVVEGMLAAYGLSKRVEVVILRLCPTSDDAPPWLWGLHARRWRVVETVKRIVEAEGPLWYEVFNVAEPEVEVVDVRKLAGFVLEEGRIGEEAWI